MLRRLLDQYEHLISALPEGEERSHVLSMLPRMRGFIEEAEASELPELRLRATLKVNRWLGFVQGWLWSIGAREVKELADETRGVDSDWCVYGHRVQGDAP